MSRDKLQNLIADFDLHRFKRFFSEKNRSFRESSESLDTFGDKMFVNGQKLGTLYYDDGSLIVSAIEVTRELTERSGKKAQYELGKKILKSTQTDSGIFIFYDEERAFRFSLIYANYLGKKRDWSSFRRFTYFVSRELYNKTFLQRIGDGDFSSLGGIKDAFSVEKVTNKFFEEFRVIFEKTKLEFEKTNRNTVCLWLKDKYSDDDYKEQVNKFTFTFLGRIIFLYFLLRKGWIENQKDYIRKIVESSKHVNLYKGIFEPLFFEVFAKKENERPREIRGKYGDTPYLNGGLFEKSELESEMEQSNIFVLFDDKFMRDIILGFFEAYNFTIDENSPDDQEVSIDPEMLGKVFENTLAEEERGKKGTFYTPREVVHFMVKESLWQFLRNETNIDSQLLHEFIYDDSFDLSILPKDKIRQIDSRLENVKILDPAVGSAAFPVEMMQVLVRLRKRLNVKVGKNISEVSFKKDFIKNNLYGVDIDPSAIEIAKLRLWLALIVEYDKSEAEPLPNLDFQFRVGNSLQEKVDDIDIFRESNSGLQGLFKDESEYDKMKSRMIGIKDKFYSTVIEAEKRKLKKEFDDFEHRLIQAVLNKYKDEAKSQLRNQHIGKFAEHFKKTIEKIDQLEKKIKDGTYKLFKPDFHFSEVFDRKDENANNIMGFDIVIGNPPYGVKVDNDIKNWHGLESKDSYGVFISTALKRFLKYGGILSYIVSDTWTTIKTHKPLREQVLGKRLHKIIRVHQDCFEATVNACIISLTNSAPNVGKLIAADLTNISTRKEVEELRNKLYHLEEFVNHSSAIFAVYEYDQHLISNANNLPIFVGSPSIFTIKNSISTKAKDFIDEICGGIKSYNDKEYLRNIHGKMGYRTVHPRNIVTRALSAKEKEEGIAVKDYDNDKYYIRYEKGGDTQNEQGILNFYYKPVEFFFPWDKRTVRAVGKNNGLRNKHRYFSKGIGVSTVGIYAPIFRYCEYDVFFNNYNIIFPRNEADTYFLLPYFCSKAFRYLLDIFENHTVAKNQVDLLEVPIPNQFNNNPMIASLCKQIIHKLKDNSCYNYTLNEQANIDKIVYKSYGFKDDDINEIEIWYARRYPKLTRFYEI